MKITKPGLKIAIKTDRIMNLRLWFTYRLSLKNFVTFFGIIVIFYSANVFAIKPNVSKRDIDRRVLFTQAFENLGFYMTAVENELRLDPNEKKAFNEIALYANTRRRAILYNEPHINLEFSANNNDFLIPGDKIRTAVTGEDPISEVRVNLNIIQDPNVSLNFLDAIQILIHEFSHKTPHSKQVYVDTMAAKVFNALKNSAVKYDIEPGYQIFILGLNNPYIQLYNFLRKKGTDDSKLLHEVYLYTLMYPGAELTMFEYRGNMIRQRQEISGYLMNPIGFSNVSSYASAAALLPMSLTSVQNITKEQVGERFPVIKISMVTHQELVEYNGSTVTTPNVVKMDLTRQMATNTIYHEVAIYTDRSGIAKFSKREYKQQYSPESAKINGFEYINGMLEGSGQLNLIPSEFEYFLKSNLQISVYLKFQGGQTVVPAQITNTKDKLEFKFSVKADPRVKTVMVDQIEMTFLYEGRYRTFVVPADETKSLNFDKTKAAEFRLMAWRVHDHRGMNYLSTGPEATPMVITQPENNSATYELAFLFKSETPIRELVISTKQGDQIHNENGDVKYSRYLEKTERIQADQFIQEKKGPYYQIFLNMGTTLTPKVVQQSSKGEPDKVAISPEYRLSITKLRAINENLQVVGIDDAVAATVLNPSRLIKQSRENKCRDRF